MNGHSNRDILLSLKSLCSEKDCFRKMKPDENAAKYYSNMMEMINAELEKDEPDEEVVKTAVADALLLLTNISAKQKDKSVKYLTLTIVEADCKSACQFVDNNLKLTKRLERKISMDNRRTKRKEFIQRYNLGQVLWILKWLLVVILLLGVLVAVSGFFIPDQEVRMTTGNLFQRFRDWFKYDVRKQALPTTLAEEWLRISRIIGKWSMVAVGASIVVYSLHLLRECIFRFKTKKILRDLKEFQRLNETFICAEKEMKELSW